MRKGREETGLSRWAKVCSLENRMSFVRGMETGHTSTQVPHRDEAKGRSLWVWREERAGETMIPMGPT